MTRLIDADTLIRNTIYNPLHVPYITKSDIEAAPTVDAVPVRHGKWISIGHKLSRICSVCYSDEPYKFADDNANVYDYCPHCGARMDEK